MSQPDICAILEQLDAWLGRMSKSDTPSLRSVRRSLSKTLANAGPSLVLAVADALVKRGSWADRLIAYETVAGHRPAFMALDETTLIRWSQGLTDWGTDEQVGNRQEKPTPESQDVRRITRPDTYLVTYDNSDAGDRVITVYRATGCPLSVPLPWPPRYDGGIDQKKPSPIRVLGCNLAIYRQYMDHF